MRRYAPLLLLLAPVASLAQTATGDARTITEPTFPAVCSTLAAPKYVVSTTAVNIDPFNPTCGSTGGTNGTLGCTGGTSFEPSSTAGSYTAAESLDNTAVQNALNACPAGQAVELTPGTSGQAGFVMGRFTIPAGVTLLVDAGVTVFASRVISDYGGTGCGQITVSGGSGCNHWLSDSGSTPSTGQSTTSTPAWGVMGYGVLDGRGWDAYVGQTTQGFYANRIQAYCNNHALTKSAPHYYSDFGSPVCTPTSTTLIDSYGPNMMELYVSNFVLYKITLKDAGNFFVNWRNGHNFLAWDAKIIAPFEVSNTDGWDPLNSSDGTWTKGFISTGDNHTALKSKSGAVQNITVSYTQTGGGVGLALGTATNAGTSNVLFDHIVQNGNLNDSRQRGLEIASSYSNGGLVNQITYQNVCMKNESNSVAVFPDYPGSGTSYATFSNIIFRNIHVLPSTAPYTTGGSGTFEFEGYDASHKTTVTLDNFVIDGSYSTAGTFQYTTATLGPAPVDSRLVSSLTTPTSDTVTGTAAGNGAAAYACTDSTWQPLIGELNLKTASANNLSSYTAPSAPATLTLQATLIPATAVSSKESYAPTSSVTFYDNGTSIGTAPLAGNGTIATLTLPNVASGTHNYTAGYSDTHYAATTFGAVTAIVPGGGGAPPSGTSITRGKTTPRGNVVIR